jgi:hypothetical protein
LNPNQRENVLFIFAALPRLINAGMRAYKATRAVKCVSDKTAPGLTARLSRVRGKFFLFLSGRRSDAVGSI